MWTLAESLLPDAAHKDDVTAYTQGLMDLGATLCVRGKPDCARCPFAADCVANVDRTTARTAGGASEKDGADAQDLDAGADRTAMRSCSKNVRRRASGADSGACRKPPMKTRSRPSRTVSAATEQLQRLAPLTHTFTHFKLDIEPRLGEVARRAARGCGRRNRLGAARRDRFVRRARAGAQAARRAARLADLKQLMVLHVVMHDIDARCRVVEFHQLLPRAHRNRQDFGRDGWTPTSDRRRETARRTEGSAGRAP